MKAAYKTTAVILIFSTLFLLFGGCASAPAAPAPAPTEPAKAEPEPQAEPAAEAAEALTFDKTCEGPFT